MIYKYLSPCKPFFFTICLIVLVADSGGKGDG